MTEFSEHRCVVVGYGSIGARHVRILKESGCSVAVVSRRKLEVADVYSSIGEAVRRYNPTYVVVAVETSRHYEVLTQLAATGYSGIVLVEKPLFESSRPLPLNQFRSVSVAYNLRFHPVITRLKELLAGQQILSAQGYVGQYLPDWRPGTDYRKSYSAQENLGGGVLLDLSHDIDYLLWMLGNWKQVAALGGQFSSLELTSDDIFALMIRFSLCPVASIQLNYLDRRGRRQLVVNTADHTYEADLVSNKILVDQSEEIFTVERDMTYRAMHAALLGNSCETACTVGEALNVLSLLKAARRSAKSFEWETR